MNQNFANNEVAKGGSTVIQDVIQEVNIESCSVVKGSLSWRPNSPDMFESDEEEEMKAPVDEIPSSPDSRKNPYTLPHHSLMPAHDRTEASEANTRHTNGKRREKALVGTGYDSDEDFEMKDKDFKWIGNGVHNQGRVFYQGVTIVGGLELRLGDTVLVKQTDPEASTRVASIRKLYKSPLGTFAHLQWFQRATEALLGNMADPQELYFTDDCEEVALTQTWRKCKVERRLFSSSSLHEQVKPGDFWVRYWHDGARWEHIQPTTIEQNDFLPFCEVCSRKIAKKPEVVRSEIGTQEILWKGKKLCRGDGVLIPPNSVQLPGKHAVENANRLQEVDNDICTEYYRKTHLGEQGQTKAPCSPLQIGQIVEVKMKTNSITLKIFYRPGDS